MVEFFHQLRRPLDVREQRRDRLAFTIGGQRSVFSKDPNGRRRFRRAWFALADCGVAMKVRGALATEIESRGIFERATGAGQAECSSALTAELHAGWIVKVALRAAHRQPPIFMNRCGVLPEHGSNKTDERRLKLEKGKSNTKP
jgi:hypothetical protein